MAVITVVVTKDGRRYQGYLWYFKPLDGYLTLTYGQHRQPDWPLEDRFYFRDIDSAMSLGSRCGIGTTVDRDELKRARNYMADARRYHWDGVDEKYPAQDWEME